MIHVHALDERTNCSAAHSLLVSHGVGDAAGKGGDACHDGIASLLAAWQSLYYHSFLPRMTALEDYAD